ncbi:MAG: type VI secretion system tip protein TssI/VgrG [Myxococcota bacterium]
MSRTPFCHLSMGRIPVRRVVRLESEARVGRPARYRLEVRLDVAPPLETLLGHEAEVRLGFPEDEHVFQGVITTATVLGQARSEVNVHAFEIVVELPLALLAHEVTAVIYQEQNACDIIRTVLDRHALASEWRMTREYAPRENCVQYLESDLDFIHRLLEEEGIHYFFAVGDEGPTVVFADDSTTAPAIEGDPVLAVRHGDGFDITGDHARRPADAARVVSGSFVRRDYDFERPALDLTAEAQAGFHPDLERYDYPGGYVDPGRGSALVQTRLEAEQAQRLTVAVPVVCPRVGPGRTFTLASAGALDGDYFIVRCRHRYEDSGDDGDAPGLISEIDVIPRDAPYRLPPVTEKPRIFGPQTATVVAPEGAESETIHTDAHARSKVKFRWDRSPTTDDTASAWIRVTQLQTSGSLVLPRVGWEVIVEFLEGDPDRPVITGRLYNGAFMPLYKLPEGKTRTSLQSRSSPGGGGSNEIRMEDAAGAEEIMIHAQHDMRMATANNKTSSVGNNRTRVVGANHTLDVGADQKIQITKGNQNTITGDQTVAVGGNRSVEVNAVAGLTVGGSATTSVGGNQFEMDGNPLDALLELAAQTAQAFLEAAAAQAINQVQAHVQGAVNQVLGPVDGVVAQATSLGQGLQSMGDGNLGALPGVAGAAAGIPGASALAGAMGGQGGGGGGNKLQAAAAGALRSPRIAAQAAANQAIADGAGAAHRAMRSALGADGAGGGGASGDNAAGPEGDVGGQDETDRTKGPGHKIGKVAGAYEETVSGLKAVAMLTGHDIKVAGNMTQTAGAAHVEVCIGNRSESGAGTKTESQLGLVVLSQGGESETVTGARTSLVGGAVVDKLDGNHVVEAGGPATIMGAFHKLEAKGTITLKCGGSEVVIDSSGVTISSAMVTFMASKLHLPKKVSEV